MGVDGCAGQEAPRPRGGPHRIRSTTRQPGLGSGQLLRIKVDSGSEYGTDGTDSGKVPYRRKIPGAPQVRGTTRRYRRYLRYRRYRACTRRAVSHVRRALTIYITRDGPVHFVLVSARAGSAYLATMLVVSPSKSPSGLDAQTRHPLVYDCPNCRLTRHETPP